ncbi:melittin [Osmia lignaria lignaria]|uniref:melittin n=1 Tax=Osmia lignaria lignaria TaxID=1437193 RepID=UPI00402B6A41
MKFLLAITLIFMVLYVSLSNADPEANPSPEAEAEAGFLSALKKYLPIVMKHVG